MVRGLDTFAAFFAGDEERYALIGGVATQLVLEEAGLPARATKDLDIVLCVEVLNAAFGRKLSSKPAAMWCVSRARNRGASTASPGPRIRGSPTCWSSSRVSQATCR